MTESLRNADNGASPLVRGVQTLRERWWIVAIGGVVGVVLSAAIVLTTTKEYTASSKLLLRSSNLGALVASGAVQQSDTDPQRQAATNLQLVLSRPVADAVRKQLGLQETTDSLLARVDAQNEPEADIIDVSASDTDPKQAAAIASAFAKQFVLYRQSASRAAIRQGEQLVQARIDQLPQSATAQRAELETTLRSIIQLDALQTGDAEVVDAASVPSAPSSPKTKRDILLGLLLGLMAGVAAAFLVDVFDRVIKTAEEFEQRYGAWALATIPEHRGRPSSDRERQAAIEPFRILRSGIGFLSDGDVQVLVITSAEAGDGKSTVAAGLARASAMAGQEVVLVDADLRRPVVHDRFGLEDDAPGLTNALVGGVPAHELAHRVESASGMFVLPAGPLSPNVGELLSGPQMRAVVAELRAHFDLVIIDAPPLLPIADAQSLLEAPIDACIVVARAGSATREQVRRVRAILERHRRPFGIVVNRTRETDASYYAYGDASTKKSEAL